MTPELDADGPAAPPRANGELTFEHPWQGRLFATTMAACDAGLIEYEAFREHLIAEVGSRDVDEPGVDDYWAAWQDAFEAVTGDAGIVSGGDIDQRAVEFAAHD